MGRPGVPQLPCCRKLLGGRAEEGEDGLWAAGQPLPTWAKPTEPRKPTFLLSPALSDSSSPLAPPGNTCFLLTPSKWGRLLSALPRLPITTLFAFLSVSFAPSSPSSLAYAPVHVFVVRIVTQLPAVPCPRASLPGLEGPWIH